MSRRTSLFLSAFASLILVLGLGAATYLGGDRNAPSGCASNEARLFVVEHDARGDRVEGFCGPRLRRMFSTTAGLSDSQSAAVDRMGRVYVSNSPNSNPSAYVTAYDASGRLIQTLRDLQCTSLIAMDVDRDELFAISSIPLPKCIHASLIKIGATGKRESEIPLGFGGALAVAVGHRSIYFSDPSYGRLWRIDRGGRLQSSTTQQLYLPLALALVDSESELIVVNNFRSLIDVRDARSLRVLRTLKGCARPVSIAVSGKTLFAASVTGDQVCVLDLERGLKQPLADVKRPLFVKVANSVLYVAYGTISHPVVSSFDANTLRPISTSELRGTPVASAVWYLGARSSSNP